MLHIFQTGSKLQLVSAKQIRHYLITNKYIFTTVHILELLN